MSSGFNHTLKKYEYFYTKMRHSWQRNFDKRSWRLSR